MKLFQQLYQRVVHWSQRPSAFYYLLALSFSEASFFPVPPDVLLAPMTLARPQYGWRYAAATTLASVLGGLLGYMIGAFAIHLIQPYLIAWGYAQTYQHAVGWFQHWGGLALVIAGFTPVPYKFFTVAAGALHLPLPVFILASLIGRGGRFYLEVAAIKLFGPGINRWLVPYIDYIGWGSLIILFLAWGLFR